MKLFTIFTFLLSSVYSIEPTIIALGPPGSGKGTFSQYFKTNHNYTHISAGDVVRDEIYKETPVGLKIKDIVEKGKYIDSSVIQKLILNKINLAISEKKPFILDGFGRTEEDVTFLLNTLESMHLLSNTLILFFNADQTICSKRILTRSVCKECKHIFSNKKDCCSLCGGDLKVRLNDDKNSILRRFEEYNDFILPNYLNLSKQLPTLYINANAPLDKNLIIYRHLAETLETFKGDTGQFVKNECALISSPPSTPKFNTRANKND